MRAGWWGPDQGGPFAADDPGEPLLVDGVVGHDVELAAVFEDAGDDARGDGPAIDDEVDLVVRDATAVVDLGGVEDRQVQRPALVLPAVENGLRQDVVQQAAQAGTVRAG